MIWSRDSSKKDLKKKKKEWISYLILVILCNFAFSHFLQLIHVRVGGAAGPGYTLYRANTETDRYSHSNSDLI